MHIIYLSNAIRMPFIKKVSIDKKIAKKEECIEIITSGDTRHGNGQRIN